jgi:hypothetical protein
MHGLANVMPNDVSGTGECRQLLLRLRRRSVWQAREETRPTKKTVCGLNPTAGAAVQFLLTCADFLQQMANRAAAMQPWNRFSRSQSREKKR